MDCISVLKRKGYNLKGYSPDFYDALTDNNATTEEECEGLMAWAEAVYG